MGPVVVLIKTKNNMIYWSAMRSDLSFYYIFNLYEEKGFRSPLNKKNAMQFIVSIKVPWYFFFIDLHFIITEYRRTNGIVVTSVWSVCSNVKTLLKRIQINKNWSQNSKWKYNPVVLLFYNVTTSWLARGDPIMFVDYNQGMDRPDLSINIF